MRSLRLVCAQSLRRTVAETGKTISEPSLQCAPSLPYRDTERHRTDDQARPQIPKNLRLMYVHSWQSYIWNRLVSERVKLFGVSTPVVGDLVYAGDAADEDVAADEEGEASVSTEVDAPAPVADPNAATPADTAAANPQLAHFIATSSVAKVRALTAEDIASGKYTVNDVVLPMPGFAVTYPAGEIGEVYRRVIREDGVDPDNMWRKQKEYSLVRIASHLSGFFRC